MSAGEAGASEAATSVVAAVSAGGKARIVSLSSAVVDVALTVRELPSRGADMVASQSASAVGGGFNVVAAAARQGARCVYAAPHGDGPYGQLVREAMRAEGVEVALPLTEGVDSGFTVALVEPNGERTMVTSPGAEALVTADALSRLDVRPTDWVALSGYDLAYPHSGAAIAEWCGTVAHARLAVDVGPLVGEIPDAVMSEVVPRLALLTLNQREARLFLAGSASGSWASGSSASGLQLLAGVRAHPLVSENTLVVVREGAAGCVASDGIGEWRVPAPRVQAVDTTGAGDAHFGVLLAFLAAGVDAAESLRAATSAAALAVTRFGPATAPSRDELARVRATTEGTAQSAVRRAR